MSNCHSYNTCIHKPRREFTIQVIRLDCIDLGIFNKMNQNSTVCVAVFVFMWYRKFERPMLIHMTLTEHYNYGCHLHGSTRALKPSRGISYL